MSFIIEKKTYIGFSIQVLNKKDTVLLTEFGESLRHANFVNPYLNYIYKSKIQNNSQEVTVKRHEALTTWRDLHHHWHYLYISRFKHFSRDVFFFWKISDGAKWRRSGDIDGSGGLVVEAGSSIVWDSALNRLPPSLSRTFRGSHQVYSGTKLWYSWD